MPDPVPLYTWVVPLNQLIRVWVPCLNESYRFRSVMLYAYMILTNYYLKTVFTNTFYSNCVYGLRHPALRETRSLSPAFCKIYQTGYMARSSCFQNSAVKCACLPRTGYDPSTVPISVRPQHEQLLFHRL